MSSNVSFSTFLFLSLSDQSISFRFRNQKLMNEIKAMEENQSKGTRKPEQSKGPVDMQEKMEKALHQLYFKESSEIAQMTLNGSTVSSLRTLLKTRYENYYYELQQLSAEKEILKQLQEEQKVFRSLPSDQNQTNNENNNKDEKKKKKKRKKRFDFTVEEMDRMKEEKELYSLVEREMVFDFFHSYLEFNQKYSSSPTPSRVSNDIEEDEKDNTNKEEEGKNDENVLGGGDNKNNKKKENKKERDEWTKVLLAVLSLYYENKREKKPKIRSGWWTRLVPHSVSQVFAEIGRNFNGNEVIVGSEFLCSCHFLFLFSIVFLLSNHLEIGYSGDIVSSGSFFVPLGSFECCFLF
jgi:hypothetical protein